MENARGENGNFFPWEPGMKMKYLSKHFFLKFAVYRFSKKVYISTGNL